MVSIRVPATTANLGCGFDTLGLALSLYTTFDFEIIDSGFELVGFEDRFNNKDNLVYTSFLQALKKLGKEVSGVKITIKNDVPVSRGLGSSATCVVGGIYGAYVLTNTEINRQEIFSLATEIEGHPDNVSPAIYGSLSASCTADNREAITVNYDIDERFNFLALIPNFETSTKQAREVMPGLLSMEDAIYSLSRLGLVLKGFENYDLELLTKVMGDKIHEPYRKKIINEYEDVREICQSIDSVCFIISGSGSTLMNIVEDKDSVSKIEQKLKKLKYNWRALLLTADKVGTVVL